MLWKLYICLINHPLSFNITVFTLFIRYDIGSCGYWYFHRGSVVAIEAWACVHVRARAGGSRFLRQRAGYHSRSHACPARTFRRQKSAGRDRSGEKREIRVNVRNTCGFAVWEFKRVVYNSKCRVMPIKAHCLMTFEIDLNFKHGNTSK